MAKTQTPSAIDIAGTTFRTNAVPDVFDARDLVYRPVLELLPPMIDHRDRANKARFVLKQSGNSCTGHAVAAMVDLIRSMAARRATPDGVATAQIERVSPYMLYRLARRYDEFEGEDDVGSSLRGALKGWFHHGVCRASTWPGLRREADLADRKFIDECREIPLGAYYRVNADRLDDMQSAIAELGVIVASAAIHEGWVNPALLERDGESMRVIERSLEPEELGGHAFALVGYNRVGFLVQNSWGRGWGDDGFATLTYEDWIESAYDAWVARPGVPHTPFAGGLIRAARSSGGVSITAGPDLDRLRHHVVNLGNNGRLSGSGKFVSNPQQIEEIFGHMKSCHDHWSSGSPGARRQIVLYAHGGLNSESTGLRVAERQLNWWLNNHIYPVSFAWETGAGETLVDQFQDLLSNLWPFGGIGDALREQWDRRCEKVARTSIKWMWDEMKENARKASTPAATANAASTPGGTFIANRLAKYIAENGRNVDVHLVGHSAGAIFHSYLLERLAALGVPVKTISLLAPAVRVDLFAAKVLPRLGAGRSGARLALFNLTNKRELDDSTALYRKSLLYLVSRALEPLPAGKSEAPILGMEKHLDTSVPGGSLRTLLTTAGAKIVIAPDLDQGDGYASNSEDHGGFDDDALTMTTVARHVLGAEPVPFVAGMPLDPAVAPPMAVGEARVPLRAAFALPAGPAATRDGDLPLESATPERVRVEVAQAPITGSPGMDVLVYGEGWTKRDAEPVTSSPRVAKARPRKR